MTFEHWWASITESERRMVGEGYARYIWTTAQAAVKPAKAEAAKPLGADPRQLDIFKQ